jgi:hypothetical protein
VEEHGAAVLRLITLSRVPTLPEIPAEPCVRRILVPAFRRAMVDIFGEGGRDRMVANLSGESRDEFVQDVVGAHRVWFPVRHIIAWGFATWEGPADRNRDAMARFVRRQWDLSTGVVRRVLLHMAQPQPIVARLPGLWKQDNTAGELEAALDDGGNGATLHLSDNPMVDTPHGRASVAEIYRHAFSQTRAKNVTESHALDGPKRMVIRLKWTT